MKKEKRQYLVLGLGRFGTSVAHHLCRLGHEVLAVDSNENLVEAASAFVTQAIQADATDEAALREIGPAGFDAAIVAMGSNIRDSVLITVLCKELGVPLVIAKAVDDLHAKVLRKVGADRVVFPERDMGQRLARGLDAPNILELIELSGDYRMAEIVAPERWIGRSLMAVNVRRDYGMTVVGIRRDGAFLPSPGAEEVFHADDVLLVLGRAQDIDAL